MSWEAAEARGARARRSSAPHPAELVPAALVAALDVVAALVLLNARLALGALFGVDQDPVGGLALVAALGQPGLQPVAGHWRVRLLAAAEAEAHAAVAAHVAHGVARHKGVGAARRGAPGHVLGHAHKVLLLKERPARGALCAAQRCHHARSDGLSALLRRAPGANAGARVLDRHRQAVAPARPAKDVAAAHGKALARRARLQADGAVKGSAGAGRGAPQVRDARRAHGARSVRVVGVRGALGAPLVVRQQQRGALWRQRQRGCRGAHQRIELPANLVLPHQAVVCAAKGAAAAAAAAARRSARRGRARAAAAALGGGSSSGVAAAAAAAAAASGRVLLLARVHVVAPLVVRHCTRRVLLLRSAKLLSVQ